MDADAITAVSKSDRMKPKWYPIPRDERGNMDINFLDELEKHIPFFYHIDGCSTPTDLVWNLRDFYEWFKDDVMCNPYIIAYCPFEIPKYEKAL